MTAATPPVSIYNLAMAELGEEPVAALTNATKPMRLFIANWDTIRRDALASGVWDWATERVILAADPTPPVFGDCSRFALPADFIRLKDVRQLDREGWKIEGSDDDRKWLLADSDQSIDLIYIADKINWQLYDAKFIMAAGLLAAEFLHPSVTQSESKREATAGRAQNKLGEGRLIDALDDSSEAWVDGGWLGSRA